MTQKSCPVKIALWLEDNWAQLLTNVGTLFLAISGVLVSADKQDLSWVFLSMHGLLLVSGIALNISGSIFTWKQNTGIRSLNNKYEKLSSWASNHKDGYFQILEETLKLLAENINFGDNERISVYKHDGSAFIMLGRYSSNPEFNKPGRAIYPDNQGCIGEAWRNGSVEAHSLPLAFDLYCQKLSQTWRFEREVVSSFKMRSRSIAAYGINSRSGRRVAVIVFESIDPKHLDTQKIESALNRSESQRISYLLGKMKAKEPTGKYSIKEGF